MKKNKNVLDVSFGSLEQEIQYLNRKISFLLSHAEILASDNEMFKKEELALQIKELRDIKNSRSWKITRPLRQLNRIFKLFKKKLRS